ncbi:MAG TPA: murein L,D-transpeptidase family protein [Hyphomicrobiaceae bacterium]|nr:murein L,D-transpeptidase family protein [Hyphomicrobiaceae bacterium]
MKSRVFSLVRAVLLLGIATAGRVGPAAAADDATRVEVNDTPTGDGPQTSLGKPGSAQLAAEAPAAEPLEARLAERGLKLGNPILIRIFKEEAELELWMAAGARFELFTTYLICNWSGTLGPKRREGDKQSPEGLYAIGRRQMRHSARWRRSLDIGYPNVFDRAYGRTGSYVLLHGGCTSTGCFAMTDPSMEEIFRLSRAALANGQKHIQVHAFPFRMTDEKLAAHANSEWDGFWANLKEAYDLFERSRLPPSVRVCNLHYVVSETETNVRPGSECRGAVGVAGLISAPRTRSDGRRIRRRSAIKAYAAARKARLAARARIARIKARSRQAAQYGGRRRLTK